MPSGSIVGVSMPRTVTHLLSTCSVLLLAAAATAQKREPVRGSVATGDGEPWAGAQVELLSRPLPDDDRFGEADVLVATSDAKGRFQVMLLPGRRYLAWASAEQADGTYVASRPVEDVRAGQPLELIADAPRPHATVQIDGLQPWRAHGAIDCTLLRRGEVLLVKPCREHDGKLVLPAFPGRRAGLELRCGEQPLLPWPAAIDLRLATVQRVRVDPPRALRFRCLDAAQQPVAGAAYVASDFNGRHSAAVIARSDADGMLVPLLPLPASFAWANYPMLLSAAGRAPRSWINTLKFAAAYDAAKDPPLQTWVLDDGRHLQSRLRLGDDAVGEGLVRVVGGMATADKGQGTHEVSRCVPLGDGGDFAVFVDPTMPAVLTVFLPATVQARLPRAAGFPLHDEVLLAAVGTKVAAPLPQSLDLLQLAALDITVLDADGAPADSAAIGLCVPAPEMQCAVRAITDRTGRVRVLVPRHQALVLCSWSADGNGDIAIDTGDLRAPVQLRLRSCRRLPGEVADGKGHAVPWSEVLFFTGNDSDTAAGALAHCLDHHLRVPTDGAGRFAVPLYPGLRYSLTVVHTPDDDHYPKVDEFTAGGDEPAKLNIDLSARR